MKIIIALFSLIFIAVVLKLEIAILQMLLSYKTIISSQDQPEQYSNFTQKMIIK